MKCYYCEVEKPKLTIDHIKPLSKGGSWHDNNIVYACSKCNSSKGNLSLDEMIIMLNSESRAAKRYRRKGLTEIIIKNVLALKSRNIDIEFEAFIATKKQYLFCLSDKCKLEPNLMGEVIKSFRKKRPMERSRLHIVKMAIIESEKPWWYDVHVMD